MSLQWSLVAALLYSELALTCLLLLPSVSNRLWTATLSLTRIRRLEKQAIYYFYVVVCVLLLAFLDSIREMQKYAQRDESVKRGAGTLTLQMQHQMKLFRAQRNFYIVGFTLFLCLVIRRLLGLILSNAQTQRELTPPERSQDARHQEINKEMKDVMQKLMEYTDEIRSTNLDCSSLRNQCEYLMVETKKLEITNRKLQKHVQ